MPLEMTGFVSAVEMLAWGKVLWRNVKELNTNKEGWDYLKAVQKQTLQACKSHILGMCSVLDIHIRLNLENQAGHPHTKSGYGIPRTKINAQEVNRHWSSWNFQCTKYIHKVQPSVPRDPSESILVMLIWCLKGSLTEKSKYPWSFDI